MRNLSFFAASCLLAVACGEDPLPCDFTEAADGTNAATAEATSVAVGLGTKTLCGKVDGGHFTAPSVDVDTFRVTVAADASFILQLRGDAGGAGLAALSELSVVVRDTTAHPAIVAAVAFDATLADHAAALGELPAGDYDVTVSARAAADVAAALAYEVRFVEDKPTRCAQITTAATYAEALDGADSSGNDVFTADFSHDPPFAATAATTDAAEPTGLTIDDGASALISGAAAMVTRTDQYQDRDAFAIKTGPAADELTVRLDWVGMADLDVAVFAADATTPTGLGNLASMTSGERATFAVKPDTMYWVWVGAYRGATAYDLSICGGRMPP